MFEKKKIDYSIRACGYVRKSRKTKSTFLEIDASLTEEEVMKADLARQESLIRKLADREGVYLTHIYREVVSGESLQERPEAKEMLRGVWNGSWDAIFTTEIERLGRGSQGDQGRIVSALRHSTQLGGGGTRVVTLAKTYYPDNEGDMEYIEFGLFMSARELNTIKRRLQYGKINSVLHGEFVATQSPYGYTKVNINGCKTLEQNNDSDVVKLIFGMVASGHSSLKVADWLNEMMIPSPNCQKWSAVTIRKIIKNDVYLGYVYYGKNKTVAEVDDELNIHKKRKNVEDYIKVKGLHEPIINEDFALFTRAQLRYAPPVNPDMKMRNPFAGLMYCDSCGASLGIAYNYRMKDDRIIHRSFNKPCSCPALSYEPVIKEIEKQLSTRFGYLKNKIYENNLSTEEQRKIKKIAKLKYMNEGFTDSLNNAFDLLDRGIISEGDFIARRKYLISQKEETDKAIALLERRDIKEATASQYERLSSLVSAIKDNQPVEYINRLAKRCIAKINIAASYQSLSEVAFRIVIEYNAE